MDNKHIDRLVPIEAINLIGESFFKDELIATIMVNIRNLENKDVKNIKSINIDIKDPRDYLPLVSSKKNFVELSGEDKNLVDYLDKRRLISIKVSIE